MPYITASATVDDGTREVILKLVNIRDDAIDLPLSFDCEIGDTAAAEILTGESKCAKNTMDAPEAVVPRKTTLTGVSAHYTYSCLLYTSRCV